MVQESATKTTCRRRRNGDSQLVDLSINGSLKPAPKNNF